MGLRRRGGGGVRALDVYQSDWTGPDWTGLDWGETFPEVAAR